MVRHGEAAASWGESSDPGLSATGHQQAEDTAAELVEVLGGVTPRLVSSPLLRAQQTAGALAGRLGVPASAITIDERFKEIPSPVPLAQRQDWLRAFMQSTWSEQSEVLHAWRVACIEGVKSLTAPTVVFSHFLVINALVGATQGSDKTLVFWPDNASITRFQIADGKLRCLEQGRAMPTQVN